MFLRGTNFDDHVLTASSWTPTISIATPYSQKIPEQPHMKMEFQDTI